MIEEFIHRRFPVDCDWTTGNCYFFAVILDSVFYGKIVYDLIDGHFLFLFEDRLYDYNGLREDLIYEPDRFVDWNTYYTVDPLHYERIVHDCID